MCPTGRRAHRQKMFSECVTTQEGVEHSWTWLQIRVTTTFHVNAACRGLMWYQGTSTILKAFLRFNFGNTYPT